MTTLTTTPMNQSVFQKDFDTLRCPLPLNFVFIGEAAVRARFSHPRNIRARLQPLKIPSCRKSAPQPGQLA
jgi:hypothetical protein